MSDLTLSNAVRNSLLSLQSTTQLIERTQGRLSSGLKVGSPVDDPVAFFQAKTLNDRAFDFDEKKGSIDQGISTVTAAIDGVNTIETLVRQLKGISNSLKSADATQLSDLVTQFNDLRTQIDNLAADASYQGTNLINGTGTTLGVEFSDQSASILNIDSTDLRVGTGGLSIASAVEYTGATVTYAASANVLTGSYLNSASLGVGQATGSLAAISHTADITLTWDGLAKTFTGGTVTFTYGTNSLAVTVAESASITAQGATITIDIATALTASTADFKILGADSISTLDAVTYSAQSGILSAASAQAGGITGTPGNTILVTYNGADIDVTGTETIEFIFGSGQYTLQLETGVTTTYGTAFSAGEILTVYLAAAGATAGTGAASTGAVGDHIYLSLTASSGLTAGGPTAGHAAYTGAGEGLAFTADIAADTQVATRQLVEVGNIDAINSIITGLDAALSTLRTQASSLGSNVAVLQTRLEFTDSYVNTLESGASKLTLADLNEEGANLLALQTRQQLGIQALSFAGQAEQSILALFR